MAVIVLQIKSVSTLVCLALLYILNPFPSLHQHLTWIFLISPCLSYLLYVLYKYHWYSPWYLYDLVLDENVFKVQQAFDDSELVNDILDESFSC